MGRKKSKKAAASSRPPPSSKAKDYSMEKPVELQDELDELRNRGIAKLLNRHFTETTKRVAEEKAAVDAALQDLEERRARTSEFVPSKGGELHPFDSLYVELQQKKAESRRKEKETLLLYQRYVQKFGNTGLVAAPEVNGKAKDEKDSSPANSHDSGSTPPAAPPPPDTAPVDIQPATLLAEDTTSMENAEPQITEPDASMEEPDDGEEPAGSVEDTPSVPEEAVENVLEDTNPPENHTSGKDDENLQDENGESQSANGQEKKPTIDDEPVQVEQSVPAATSNAGDKAEPSSDAVPTSTSTSACDDAKPSSTPPTLQSNEHEAKERPKQQDDIVEPAAARGIPVASPDKSGSEASDVGRPAREISAEVPAAATASDDDSIRSIISGLTSINSAVTRQVLDEVETQLETFIKTETDAIRRIMSEEEKSYTSSIENSSASLLGNESQACTLKAEAMAKQMQDILNDFGKDPSVANADEENNDEAMSKKSGYPRKYETANESEEWTVHYDERYQREYYHESRSNRTQWEPPQVEAVDADLLSHADVRPESQGRRSSVSRRSIYRKKMRRKRMRRLVVLLFFFVLAGCAGLYWKQYHPEKSLQQVSTLMVDKVKSIDLQELKQYAIDQYEYTFTDRRDREEAQRKDDLKKKAAQKEREKKAKEDAERKARQEAERKAAEERRRKQKIAADLKLKEEKRRRELEEAKQEEFRRLMKSVEKEKTLKASEERRRPWGCNLPLAYILHGRCRRLASQNPMYNERDLVHSFMQ